MHGNNIALGHQKGITVLSAIPSNFKLNRSIVSEFAKEHTFKINKEYNAHFHDVQTVIYTSQFLVASNLQDQIWVIDHINSTEYTIPSKGSLTSMNILDTTLVFVYDDCTIEIYNLTNRKVVTTWREKLARLAKFNSTNPDEIAFLDQSGVLKITNWISHKCLKSFKLNNCNQIIDIKLQHHLLVSPVYKLPHAVYLRPANDVKFGAFYQSGHLQLDSKIIPVPSLAPHTIICGEVGPNFIALVTGAKLFLVKI